jgi:hypothetical protein
VRSTRYIFVFLAACLGLVESLGAQVIPGMSYSGSFDSYFQSWEITEGDLTTKVNQVIMPIGLFVPVTDRMDLRIASSYASFGRDGASGGSESVSGLTDVRFQANYALLDRKLLLGVVANIPTGNGELTSVQQDIVYDFVSPDLSVRANRLGEGLNLGGTLTFATPISSSAILSIGAGVIGRGAYDTSLPTSDGPINLEPGIVANGSAGIDVFSGASHVRLSSTLSYYGTERVNGADYYKIGPEIAVVANYGLSYSQSKGRFSAGLHQIIRLDNSIVGDGTFGTEPISGNGSYLAVSIANGYAVARSVILDVSALARVVGKNGYEVGDNTALEGGLGVTFIAAPGIALTVGGRYISGSGTGFTGLDRKIKGIEGTFRLVAQLPQ